MAEKAGFFVQDVVGEDFVRSADLGFDHGFDEVGAALLRRMARFGEGLDEHPPLGHVGAGRFELVDQFALGEPLAAGHGEKNSPHIFPPGERGFPIPMDADAGIAADAVEFRFDAGDRLGEVAAGHADEAFVILLAELPVADVRRITGDDFFDRFPPKLGPDRKNLADAGPIAGKLVAEFGRGIVQQADRP